MRTECRIALQELRIDFVFVDDGLSQWIEQAASSNPGCNLSCTLNCQIERFNSIRSQAKSRLGLRRESISSLLGYVRNDICKKCIIPFIKNNFIFERVKASGFNNLYWTRPFKFLEKSKNTCVVVFPGIAKSTTLNTP
jgi:hypothetical protein